MATGIDSKPLVPTNTVFLGQLLSWQGQIHFPALRSREKGAAEIHSGCIEVGGRSSGRPGERLVASLVGAGCVPNDGHS